MSSDDTSGSGDVYMPGSDYESSEDSDLGDEYDSDDELIAHDSDEEEGPITDDGWCFLTDIFQDGQRPEPVPHFNDHRAGI